MSAFLPEEAEQILREKWDGAEDVGGFWGKPYRDFVERKLLDEFHGAIAPYDLIGEVSVSGYDEGRASYLFVKKDDGSLWLFEQGSNIHCTFGESFDEIEPVTMERWLQIVDEAEDFVY